MVAIIVAIGSVILFILTTAIIEVVLLSAADKPNTDHKCTCKKD